VKTALLDVIEQGVVSRRDGARSIRSIAHACDEDEEDQKGGSSHGCHRSALPGEALSLEAV
jgi:hypothetical protein